MGRQRSETKNRLNPIHRKDLQHILRQTDLSGEIVNNYSLKLPLTPVRARRAKQPQTSEKHRNQRAGEFQNRHIHALFASIPKKELQKILNKVILNNNKLVWVLYPKNVLKMVSVLSLTGSD